MELWLAWQKVKSEIDSGNMGPEFERSELNAVAQQIRNAGQEAVEEAHASYRFISLQDSQAEKGLKTIDLGAGHSGSTETPSARVVNTLRREELLNESVGAGYIDRNWPPALVDSGAWPLSSLRQSFLNGLPDQVAEPRPGAAAESPRVRRERGLRTGLGREGAGELQPVLVPAAHLSRRGEIRLGDLPDNQEQGGADVGPAATGPRTGTQTGPPACPGSWANSSVW